MAKKITISNTGACDLTFPSGDQIAVGQSAPITSDDLDHNVVKGWLASGMIKKGEIVAEEPAAAASDAAVKKVADDNAAAAEAAAAAQKKAEDDAAAKAAADAAAASKAGK